MRRTYFVGMLADLIGRSAHPNVTGVDSGWRGPGGGEHETGLRVGFGNGAELYLKITGVSSGPGGGHSGGPDVYDAADVPGDVGSVGGDGPYRAGGFLAFLANLLEQAKHREVEDVQVDAPYGQPCLRVRLVDGHRLVVMPVRASGPGGRRAGSDYQVAEVMA